MPRLPQGADRRGSRNVQAAARGEPDPAAVSLRALFRYLAYPIIAISGAVAIIAAETSGAGYWPLVPIVLMTAAVVVASLERLNPYAPAWNRDASDTGVDILHLIGNVALGQVSLLVFALVRPLWTGLDVWPTSWPFWAEALLALAIVDLGLYGVHRASHALGWLWRLHAIHHSSRRIYWVNGQRRHLLHELIEGTPGLLFLFATGAPSTVYATAIAIVTLHLLLQHANIDYKLGPFRLVFSVAELHRWHHQRRWQDVQGNYAAVFSIWDQLFGTALRWRGDAPLDVGMDDEPDLPGTYLGQLAWPLSRGGRR